MAAATPLLAACGGLGSSKSTDTTRKTIKIGFVSPRTGATAGFGEPDAYVLELARKAFGSDVQILDRDSQSNPQRSAQVANDLINGDQVDLMLTTSTPETVNPVSDACEAAGVPCVSTVVPWEAWYFGRGAKPDDKQAYKFTYHFCFGVEQFHNMYTHEWPQVATNKKVGVMWPNDSDGNAIRAALGPLLKQSGYTIVDPGAYTDGTNDFSAQIARFKAEKCEIFNTFPIPPDFATFWRQAAQQGYRPKICQVAKTGLFPSQVEALGDIGVDIAGGAYWAPTYPYKSSLTGVTSQALGDGYQAAGKQWNQQLGPSLALFDVAAAALKAADPKDKQALAKAIGSLDVETPIGRLQWGKGPNANVVATPILGGQWIKATDSRYKVEFVLVENSSDPNVPVAAKLREYRG
ncbi:branched-chain amino acid transport system substrate-binding protein [Actinoplanes tereljensis]|uniref:ABC transporter substrate-binding protein n=1 Tax=Paractinoplanes tereljensis TaxID=571912 RepID=A0A919NM27_9ACTN|nr:ABC transporter substrate-binding protein [Actinoplanes tereljensis]GIF20097.1 ABC transporter substrate-binding protein [Actinoplanes tereljensis]